MDFEALGHGILENVVVQAGTRAVHVSSRIAVLAQLNDHPASLEVRQEEEGTQGGIGALKRKNKVDEGSPGGDTRSTMLYMEEE